jgi:hypothetical protein
MTALAAGARRIEKVLDSMVICITRLNNPAGASRRSAGISRNIGCGSKPMTFGISKPPAGEPAFVHAKVKDEPIRADELWQDRAIPVRFDVYDSTLR